MSAPEKGETEMVPTGGTEETKGEELKKSPSKKFMSQSSMDWTQLHYRNSLRNDDEKAAIDFERQYPIGIAPHDRTVIACCFLSLWGLMAFLFYVCWILNTLADTSETLWAFFGCMVATFVAIGLSIHAGVMEKEEKLKLEAAKANCDHVQVGFLVEQGKV